MARVSKKPGEETHTFLVDSINEMREQVIENNAAMRELRGEVKEFKEHVVGRVGRLEKKEGEQTRNFLSTLSLLVSTTALLVSVIVNFFRHGGR